MKRALNPKTFIYIYGIFFREIPQTLKKKKTVHQHDIGIQAVKATVQTWP